MEKKINSDVNLCYIKNYNQKFIICMFFFLIAYKDIINDKKKEQKIVSMSSIKIPQNLKAIFHSCTTRTTRQHYTFRLIFYAFMIVTTHGAAYFYFQKLFKTSYPRSSLDVDGLYHGDYFTDPYAFTLFTYLFCFLILYVTQQKKQDNPQQYLPWVQSGKIAITNVLINVLISIATILSSFIVISIMTSCQLITVVLLAVFFSKVSPRFRVHKRQILISGFICLGVIIYVYNDQGNEQNTSNKPLGWLSFLVLLAELFLYSIRAEMFVLAGERFPVSTTMVTYQVSKYSLLLIIIVSAVSTELWKTLIFVWQHENILFDLMFGTLLSGIGLIYCYRTCVEYKSYIMPTIGAVRKLLSLLLSAIYFHHNLNGYQYMGIVFVFGGIFVDIYLSSKLDGEKIDGIQTKRMEMTESQELKEILNPQK